MRQAAGSREKGEDEQGGSPPMEAIESLEEAKRSLVGNDSQLDALFNSDKKIAEKPN